MKVAALILFLVMALPVGAWPMQCKLSPSSCIEADGAKFTSKEALSVMALCDDLAGDEGRIAMRLSFAEVERRTNGRTTTLTRAWFAYSELLGSDLKFERKAKPEENNHAHVMHACRRLEVAFNRWSADR